MVAGLNLLINVLDYSYNSDDDIGGALPSGTVSYYRAQARISSVKPTYAVLQQGVETVEFFTGAIYPMNVPIANNNEIEVVAPISSSWYGERFRVVGNAMKSSTAGSDSRGYLLVSLRRVERSRDIQ